MGGGSFRAPSRSYTAPRGGYSSPGGYGGGYGFPFIVPFFGFGGGFGGLFTILIFIAIANFLVKSVRNFSGTEEGVGVSNPQVSVAKVQVGLLASARYLQKELNDLAFQVDTSTARGRADLLQESTLALLRHPEYWVYGNAEAQQAALNSAESRFNQWTLAERSKFDAETLSNVNNLLKQASPTALPSSGGELAENLDAESGYILATLIVGTQGKLSLPQINDSQDLRQALQQLGSIGSENLLAIEVLWTPQAEGDVLSTDDILAAYPNLKLV
jgi:uncharacterized membrane protein